MTKERNDGAEVLTVGTFREGLSKLEGDISRLAAEMGLLRQQGTNLESRMTVIEARMGGRLGEPVGGYWQVGIQSYGLDPGSIEGSDLIATDYPPIEF